ncbi:trypsin-like peptidase domain-containing protein [Microbacterium sp. BWT-B31]|uniref:S1C family serine protease n=1 Tax=Microbacterium sp. BWT-B31 TaxID=3232072 RepID=UPI003527A183
MSDIQDGRPSDPNSTPEHDTAPGPESATPEHDAAPAPESAAPAAPAPQPEQAPPPAQQPAAHVPPQAPAAPVPPQASVPPQAAPGAQPTTPWQPPAARPTQPGYPQTYAGQPAQPGQALARPPQHYAGQAYQGHPAHPGQAHYGAAQHGQPSQTQPTLPLGPAGSAPTGTVPTSGAPAAPKPKSGAGKVVGILVAAALVGGAAGIGGAWAGSEWFAPASTTPVAGPQTVTVNNTDSVNQTTAIAAKVVPSVVTISASDGSSGGTGSGVVLSDDGYVVTNTHVVTLDGQTGSAAIRVTTSDGRVFDAKVIGTDPTYDLAVIKLKDASGLTPVELGDSSKLNVGDTAVAIGAPLGLSNTVTTGIVSALNRSIQIASSAAPESGDQDEDQGTPNGENGPFQFDFGQGQQQAAPSAAISIAVIQTDAAINPGNSGGALVDSQGRLIGINVAIATAGGGSSEGNGSIGVGFSIPVGIVKRITGEIIENGEATHGLLGANVRAAASVEGSTITGAYIAKVEPGGAAEKAGLAAGDIVTEFNGVPITGSVDLTAQVRAVEAGGEATLTFVRDGTRQTADVTLGTLAP